MRNPKTKALVISGLIAALYTALGLAFAPITFGPVQFRIAEALTLLAVFSPVAVWGISVGCLMTNIIGMALGLNFAIDILVGTLATVLAGICSYALRNVRIKKLPVLAAIPPVLFNAFMVGAELTILMTENWTAEIFWFNVLTVGLGEAAACFILGLPMVYALEKTGVYKKLFN